MSEQFSNQGGVSNSDPNPLVRWATSKFLCAVSDPKQRAKKRIKQERARQKSAAGHVVEYFHQVDDGYSHLAAQLLSALAERYDIELVCHLVSDQKDDNAPEPELLQQLSRYDAFHVAPDYGLNFPEHSEEPQAALVDRATAILASQDSATFIQCAAEVGDALWRDNQQAMEALVEQYGGASEQLVADKLTAGNARRKQLNHYSGAMFYYAGEWYWGVDRLYHLEQRLAQLGADNRPDSPLLVPRPTVESGPHKDNGQLTLEIYPSLRSPYTAIGFDPAVKLARETGVNLVIKPVLPMVMRGVPATREKGLYIFTDVAREAPALGMSFGNIYDPIGDPVRRTYSLFPWAREQGKEVALISSFLSCAFADGINTNNDRGLKKVVERAGLDWHQAVQIVGNSDWQEELEANRTELYQAGLWGVPAFRLLDEHGEQVLALWGQDRLWLFAREIQRQLDKRR